MKNRTRWRVLAPTTALVLAISLSGCFSATTPSSSSDASERVSLAMLQPPRSGLSPLSDDAFKLSRWSTAETLVALDAAGKAIPTLATSWQRKDLLTWTFSIREKVKFHNGEVLTAEDVANSLNRAAKATPIPRILNGVNLKATAQGNTVTVTTSNPDPLLANRLSSPQLAILAPAAYAGKTVNPVGTGTGPFALVKVNGIVGATLDRFDGYWGQKALAAGIDVSFVPDGTARTAALRTGSADVVEAIPAGQLATVDKKLIHEVAMPRTNTLYLNTKSGPFADPKVRAAAREAVNRADIISSVYEGRADTAKGLLGPAIPWAEKWRETADYQKIIQTHAAPAKINGVKISLGTFTDRAELPEVAVILQQQLEKAGFIVAQDVREYQFIEADALAGKFDSFILSRATVLDSGDPVAYFASDFTCKGGFSISQLCSTDVDKAVSLASETDPGEARQADTMKAEAEILASDAAIPLLHERVAQGESAGVHDAQRDPRERALITNKTRVDAKK